MVKRMVSPKAYHIDLWDPSTGPYSSTDPKTVARLTLYVFEVLHHFTNDPNGIITRRGEKAIVRLFAEALEHVPTPRTFTALHKHTVGTKTFDLVMHFVSMLLLQFVTRSLPTTNYPVSSMTMTCVSYRPWFFSLDAFIKLCAMT